MKRVAAAILSLLLISVCSYPAFSGTLTTNEFLAKLRLGARGETEKNAFDAGLDRVDARLGKEIWVGDPKYGSTFQQAVTAIGATPAILRVPSGTHNIAADLTLPATLALKPERGALISVAGGATLTIGNFIDPGLFQVFADANADNSKGVKFAKGAVPLVRPEWWGARADGSGAGAQATANKTGITKALYAGGANIWPVTVQLASGQYDTDGTISMPAGASLIGAGMPREASTHGSRINLLSDAGCHIITAMAGVNSGSTVRDLGLYGGDNANGTLYDGLSITVGNCWNIINVSSWGGLRWAVNCPAYGQGTRAIIRGCQFRSRSGVNLQWDSLVEGNEIMPGIGAIVSNYDFATDTAWTKGAGWTISGGKANHAAGATETLSQSVKYIQAGETYNVWFTVSNRTAGSATVSLGSAAGSARSGNSTAAGLTYCEELTPNASGIVTLAITPTSDFDGKIDDVRVHHGSGVRFNGSGNVCGNNIIFGDAWAMVGIDFAASCESSTTTGNRVDSSDYNVKIYAQAGVINGNAFLGARRHGLLVPVSRPLQNTLITDNKFDGNGSFHDAVQGGYGFYLAGYESASVIRNNHFSGNYTGAIYSTQLPDSVNDHNLTEANAGADIQVSSLPALPYAYNYANVGAGKYFRTNAGSSAKIGRLKGGCRGKEVVITLGETNTKLEQFNTRADGTHGHIYTCFATGNAWSGNLVGATSSWAYFGATPTVGDCIYFGDVGESGAWKGSGERICGLRIYNATPAVTGGAGNLTWEYWNGSAWATLSVSTVDIFSPAAGYQSLKFSPPADSVPVNLNALGLGGTPPDTGPRNWIRCRVTGTTGFTNAGANNTNGAGLSYLKLNGDFGPLTTGQTGTISLRKLDNGVWTEVSRFIN